MNRPLSNACLSFREKFTHKNKQQVLDSKRYIVALDQCHYFLMVIDLRFHRTTKLGNIYLDRKYRYLISLCSTNAHTSLSDLRALAKIINDSITQIEQTATNKDLQFPSIDSPYTEESEAIRKDPNVEEATYNIVSAASRLVAITRPAPHTLLTNSTLYCIPAALRVAVETHVAEVLREAGSQGLHVDQIALISNTDSNKLARILRLLATESIFREVSPDVFANNRISSLLDTGKRLDELMDNPKDKHIGSSGISALVVHCARHAGKSLPFLTETLLDPLTSKSYDPTKTAFNRAFQTDLSVFSWLEQKENEEELKIFGYAMSGVRSLISSSQNNTYTFPWNTLRQGSIVVDVGGGIGSYSLPIAKANSGIKLVIQDRASVMKDAEVFWENNFSQALTNEQVKFEANDFFTGQPIQNASIYMIKAVLHDWPDDLCLIILKHIRNAAGSDSRLLIVDRIVSYVCDDSRSSEEKKSSSGNVPIHMKTSRKSLPKPLLSNGGHAMFSAYMGDLQMMAFLNGQERTLLQFNTLLEKSGWKMSKVYVQPYFLSSYEQQIVAVPVAV